VRLQRPKISELPTVLQPAARLAQRVLKKGPYRYEGDGIATAHLSPFLTDADFESRFGTVAATWGGYDIRWRLWILTGCARHCASLNGSFAEFGVYRGGCAFMILSGAGPHSGRKYYLFDTFQGIPGEHLTENEARAGFQGRLADVSLDDVRQRLAGWPDQVEFIIGDIFQTLPTTETGPLAFVHLDLNAAEPTGAALEYIWSRLLPGGIVVFDDYGWDAYIDQRRLVDRFFGDKPDGLIALPTGQAICVKL
jgi:O-methyltransferase